MTLKEFVQKFRRKNNLTSTKWQTASEWIDCDLKKKCNVTLCKNNRRSLKTCHRSTVPTRKPWISWLTNISPSCRLYGLVNGKSSTNGTRLWNKDSTQTIWVRNRLRLAYSMSAFLARFRPQANPRHVLPQAGSTGLPASVCIVEKQARRGGSTLRGPIGSGLHRRSRNHITECLLRSKPKDWPNDHTHATSTSMPRAFLFNLTDRDRAACTGTWAGHRDSLHEKDTLRYRGESIPRQIFSAVWCGNNGFVWKGPTPLYLYLWSTRASTRGKYRPIPLCCLTNWHRLFSSPQRSALQSFDSSTGHGSRVPSDRHVFFGPTTGFTVARERFYRGAVQSKTRSNLDTISVAAPDWRAQHWRQADRRMLSLTMPQHVRGRSSTSGTCVLFYSQ